MAGEQAGAGPESAASEGGISLDDFVSDVFGDVSDSTQAVESPSVATSDAAGAPPAERQQATGEIPVATPESKDKAERTGATPADAATTKLDNGAPKTTEDADPLATATPFTYTVNGSDKTFDGIKVLGDAGAIITSEALPLLQRRLGERDNLYEQNKEQYAEIQDFGRLSEWRSQGPDGKETILSGRDGLVEMRVSHSKLEAAFNTIVGAFRPDTKGDYSLLSSLIDVDPQTNKIIVNQQVLDHLITRADLAERDAADRVKSRLAEISTPKTAGRSEEQATTLDSSALQTYAPQVIEAAAKQVGADMKLLSDADKAFLTSQFPRYLRTVTEDDRRENLSLKVGNPIVDGAFTQLVKQSIDHRKELATTAQATSSAAKDNAARLAQAALGTRATTTTRKEERQPTVEADRVSDADKAWALREKLSSGRF